MIAIGLAAPDGFRAALRSTLLRNGVAPPQLDEVADLATLAVDEALAAIERTATHASNFGAQLTILSVALGAVEAVCRSNANALNDAAKATGRRVIEASVTLSGERK